MDDQHILASRMVLPEHVFRRGFPEETIALNLESGQYHGLDPVATRMVNAASEATCIGDAVAPLAREFDQPEEIIERDLAGLCRALLDRGLIELQDADAN
jgi:hypothetical protein